MSCTYVTSQTPRVLKLKSEVISPTLCRVSTGVPADHRISAENRSLLPYIINIDSGCTTAKIRYDDAAGPVVGWKHTLHVPPRPGKGASPAAAEFPLVSLGAGRYESIETKLSWQVVGVPTAQAETATIQVETT